MKRLLIMLALVASVGLVGVRPALAQESDFFALPGDEVFPEGVAFDDRTGDFYVSSTTDGTILRGNIEFGEVEVFLDPGKDGRTTAVGLKVDREGRLFIAGGNTGLVWVYDTEDGSLLARLDTGSQPTTFINDIAIAPSGAAYVTDSQKSVMYRVTEGADGEFALETWLDFTGTVLKYTEGFNMNGLAVSGDGQYIIAPQTNTGKLYRITIASKEVVEVDLGGETVARADGILLKGRTLYLVRNSFNLIVTMQMTADFSGASLLKTYTNPDFSFPTTIALADSTMLVVNSQFDKLSAQQPPVLPFNVLAIPISTVQGVSTAPGMPRTGTGAGVDPLVWLAAFGGLAILSGVAARRRIFSL